MKRTYVVGLAGTWALLASLGYGCASDEFSGGRSGNHCSDDDCPGEAGALTGGSAAGEGAGGKGSGGTGKGGSPSGGSGNTSGDAGAPTEGGTSGTGNGGSSGTDGGSAGMGGTGGTPPAHDYLLVVEDGATAVIQVLNPATGDVESAVRFPGSMYGQPMGLTALRDGTLRLVWADSSTRVAYLMTLDADLNQVGSVPAVDRPEGFARSYTRRADGTGKLLWSLDLGSGVMMTLTSGDRPDTAVPELPVSYPPVENFQFFAWSYSIVADETARLLWSAAGRGSIVAYTAEDQRVGLAAQADGTDTDTGFDYFPMSYYVGADGLVRISWAPFAFTTPPPRPNEGIVCTYASEAAVVTLPSQQGWGAGACKRFPHETNQTQYGYSTFRP